MLKELIEETAAGGAAGVTSGAAIAGFREPIGGKSMKTGKKKSKKKKMQRRAPVSLPYSFFTMGEGEKRNFGRFLVEVEDSEFDRSDVIAKLKSAANAAEERGSDSTGFVLEDEKGSMVKVWVPDDQSDSFAQALQAALAGADENEDDQNDAIEIAEVLWKLRKQFDIINVEWGSIPEDEETPLEIEEPQDGSEIGGEENVGDGDNDNDNDAEDMTADAGEADELGADAGASEETAATALTQVIDMMKADAEARKAEAEARAAEATSRTAAEKVKQEEEVLDMEAYYKDKKEAENEAKRIAQLAKYKHDIAADQGSGLSGKAEDFDIDVESEMEEVRQDKSITKDELADMLLKALKR